MLTQIRRVPWISLGLLLVAHVALGWFLLEPGSLVDPSFAKLAWAGILVFDLIVVGTLTASPNTYRAKLVRWTSSSEGRLFSVILLALSIATFLVLVRLFGYVLIISLSLSLARLDMLAAGFKDFPVLMVLLLVSTLGFGLGWQAHRWLRPPRSRPYSYPHQSKPAQSNPTPPLAPSSPTERMPRKQP